MSDIHGNQLAIESVLKDIKSKYTIMGCILLGDVIDYGMHSNEVVEILKTLSWPILCNIQGNHEYAIRENDYTKFSSDRGRECARYTRSILNQNSWDYMCSNMEAGGYMEFMCSGKRCLAVHGSLDNKYWGKIEVSMELKEYASYDYVFSGHSHIPHYFEKYYRVENETYRNKKKTIFINPGSVGQPRNHNCLAQYAIVDIDTEKIIFDKSEYNILDEQSSYHGQVDGFYKERLSVGI